MSETQYVSGTPIPSLASLHAQLNRERPVFMMGYLCEPDNVRCLSLGTIERLLQAGSLRHALPAMPRRVEVL